MKRNLGSQLIAAQLVSATDGSNVTSGTTTVTVELDGVAGTGGTATHIANGKWEYAPIAGDTDAAHITFQFTNTSAVSVLLNVYPSFPQTVDNDTKLTTIAADVVNVDGYNLATQIGTAGAGLTNIGTIATVTNLTNSPTNGDFTATMKTSTQTAVDAAIDTAIAEVGVAAPTATPTLRTGLMLLYMALRNKLDVQTSGTDALEVHNDAGTQITSKLLTDDGSDYSEAKMA